MKNPFSPRWGVDPPVIVGRGALLDRVDEAITDGPGSPDRAMLITGVRGVGKTVFLRTAAEVAKRRDWLTVDIDTNPYMLEHFLGKLADRASQYGVMDKKMLTSIGVAGVSLGLSNREVAAASWDVRMERAIGILRSAGVGLLLTIDEVTPGSHELDTLAQAWKRIGGRRDNDVMLIMAGVPEAVGTLINPPPGSVTSFLDKSQQYTLELLTPDQARDALLIPIQNTGKMIDPDALQLAVSVSKGHPYTVQLLGWEMWKAAKDGRITLAHVESAANRIPYANSSYHFIMRDRTLAERQFLEAMVADVGPSRSRDVADRLNKELSELSYVRARLIDAGIITAAGHGWVDLAVPGLREHIQQSLLDGNLSAT